MSKNVDEFKTMIEIVVGKESIASAAKHRRESVAQADPELPAVTWSLRKAPMCASPCSCGVSLSHHKRQNTEPAGCFVQTL